MCEPRRTGGARRPGGRGRRVGRLTTFAVPAALLAVLTLVPGGGSGDAFDGREAFDAETALVREIGRPAPSTTTTSSTTTTTAVIGEQPPAPLQPAEPPLEPYADEPVVVLGTIEIPKIGLSAPLHQGISLRTIDLGPSHWPGTALPGQVGNAVIAGHRVTRTRPFRNIDQLVPGDEVIFTVGGVRWHYEMTGHEVVTPAGLHIIDQTPTATATLFACHPPGSARYRYVVRLALTDAEFAGSTTSS